MAKANERVEIIEITVDGIKYTQTRPGYYFKKTEEGQRRIPKSEWELAFEKYTEDTADEWDAESEIAERKEVEEAKDRETEDSFNDKKQTKKAAKPRKSKDIAHSYWYEDTNTVVTLTAKQVDFMRHLPDTNFWENGLDSQIWCDVLADEIGGQFAGKPMTVGAMISTLREKNLIYVGVDKVNGKKAKFFGFTELGKEVAKELGLK